MGRWAPSCPSLFALFPFQQKKSLVAQIISRKQVVEYLYSVSKGKVPVSFTEYYTKTWLAFLIFKTGNTPGLPGFVPLDVYGIFFTLVKKKN